MLLRMKKLFKLDAWKVFLLLPPVPLIVAPILSLVGKELDMPTIGVIGNLAATTTMLLAYFGWIFIAGLVLNIQNRQQGLNSFITLLFGVSLLLNFVLTPILRSQLIDFPIILKILNLLGVLSFVVVIIKVAAAFKQAEEALTNSSYTLIHYVLRIWILPIGIWTLQPRIRLILENNEENGD